MTTNIYEPHAVLTAWVDQTVTVMIMGEAFTGVLRYVGEHRLTLERDQEVYVIERRAVDMVFLGDEEEVSEEE